MRSATATAAPRINVGFLLFLHLIVGGGVAAMHNYD
jgi:hypothetical protein